MIAIIGGSGLRQLAGWRVREEREISTPFGEPSAPLVLADLANTPLIFLARHGTGHTIPPHRINYRANIYALKAAGAERIIAVAAVGGIHAEMSPARIALPQQIIDYTYGREHTFYDSVTRDAPLLPVSQVRHVDFTTPYDETLRQTLLAAAPLAGVPVSNFGVYGATQGPRLESAAEIERMMRDGCDLVGMTGMPEAALAREIALPYACVAVVANWAAGRGDKPEITDDEIGRNLAHGMDDLHKLLQHALPHLATTR